MKDWFKALFEYTSGNILSVLSFVFAAAVFYTVFWLYGVETEPVLRDTQTQFYALDMKQP